MFPLPLQSHHVAQASGNSRVSLHPGILHFNAILEPSITQVPTCFEWDSGVL